MELSNNRFATFTKSLVLFSCTESGEFTCCPVQNTFRRKDCTYFIESNVQRDQVNLSLPQQVKWRLTKDHLASWNPGSKEVEVIDSKDVKTSLRTYKEVVDFIVTNLELRKLKSDRDYYFRQIHVMLSILWDVL